MNCLGCGVVLVRRDGERQSFFERRKCCSEGCRKDALRKRIAEIDAVKVKVACTRCGAELLRSARQTKHSCERCTAKVRDAKSLRHRKHLRLESRRYRILMTALGWADFDELMAYLREVPWTCVGDQRVKDLRGAA